MNRDKIVPEYLLNNPNIVNYHLNNSIKSKNIKPASVKIDMDDYEKSLEIFHDKKAISSFEKRRKKSLEQFEKYLKIYDTEPEY